jgi:pimeloyl-ACP methyl ester carboxylesterase
MQSGRALVWPVLWGTNERLHDKSTATWRDTLESWNSAWRKRRNELGRLIDYLQQAEQFDADRIALLGISFGSSYVAPYYLVTEDRIRTAILIAAGLAPLDPAIVPAHLNPNTYWPRVTKPILILNGRYDIMKTFRPEYSALEETLGTSSENKKSIYYEASHWPLPTHRLRTDAVAWLDRYLGSAR